MSNNTVTIRDREVGWIRDEIWSYRGKFLVEIECLPDGSDEMRFCDENGNVFPDSPVVICLPEKRE